MLVSAVRARSAAIRVSHRILATVLVFVASLASVHAQDGGDGGSRAPILLSFDVEVERDVAALEILNVTVPATYFVTGEFAEAHPDIVRELARSGTIGSHSHSHPHLTQIEGDAAYEDLKRSKTALENILGVPPRWFRAPFLEMNDEVARKVKDLGFLYDSSDQERWPISNPISGLPISNAAGGILASDYEFFAVQGFSDEEALFWLKSVYMERMPSARPFVLLLHPRLAASHASVLKDFIEFAQENNAEFMTFDDYVARSAARSPSRLAFWVNLNLGGHDPAHILQDALSMRATDVFLMAKDPAGNFYFPMTDTEPAGEADLFGEILQRLKGADIKVHAWVPVNKDVLLAQQRPEWAMVSDGGEPSSQWLSPSHPDWRRHFLSVVKALITQYDLDGIHLDYIRYPDLSVDFSPRALAAARARIGDKGASISDLQSTYYLRWVDWRNTEIAALVRSVKEAIRLHSGNNVALSAALIGDAAVSYRASEYFGQDYSLLGAQLDIVMPMAYFNETQKSLQWISDVVLGTRYKVGNRPIYVGLESYQKPGAWSLDEKTFARSVALASGGVEGLAFYPYLYLFGRGDEDWNLPAAGLAGLGGVARTAVDSPGDDPSPGGGGASTRSLLTNVSSMTVGVVLISIAISFGVTGICLYIFRRRRSNVRGPAQIERIGNNHMLPPPGSVALTVLPNWQTLESEIRINPISPSTTTIISSLVSRYGSREVEQKRIAAVLEACDRTNGVIADILSDVSITKEWKNLSIHYLHECGALGLISIVDGVGELTRDGQMELIRATEDGFERETWEFIERRLHETLTAICPECGAANLAHWFWSDVECRNCECSFNLSNCNHLNLSEFEKISTNMPTKNLSAITPNA